MAAGSSGAVPPLDDDHDDNHDASIYYALVVDSGPIIRQTGLTSLRGKARAYVTVPAVLEEIRDAKARLHLEQLPFDLVTREPSVSGMKAVTDFARQTGDYQSLSNVDLQILALVYDMEVEGCGGMVDHVRKTPKRTVGVGKVQLLNTETKEGDKSVIESHIVEVQDDGVGEREQEKDKGDSQQPLDEPIEGPKSWAMIVNAKDASKQFPFTQSTSEENKPHELLEPQISDQVLSTTFGQMNLGIHLPTVGGNDEITGQFSDAESDDFDPMEAIVNQQRQAQEQPSDDEGYAASDKEISDEECDAYILDPEEAKERKKSEEIEEELRQDFPTLSASLHVPYDGSDEEASEKVNPAIAAKVKAQEKSKQALEPIAKSGKRYNSFRKYGELMKPKEEKVKDEDETKVKTSETQPVEASVADDDEETEKAGQSRIIGGMSMSGQTNQVEDDGEGWITCTKDISRMKAAGKLNPATDPNSLDEKAARKETGPLVSQRAACATTDFAMQNVILQMNLHLLSVDGMKIRKLKSWVHRCGACFKVYADNDNTGIYKKRLFCSHCGSDMIQRISASVDGKTGRLRLHLSKKYQHNLRGTKFSLPKAGSGNRFQGDLLLREDQLLMSGAWHQKVKKASGGKMRHAAASMFGSDLATNVGCHAMQGGLNGIRVGFGRRNPNASKGGRERRGKKKKNSDKACGLRRY